LTPQAQGYIISLRWRQVTAFLTISKTKYGLGIYGNVSVRETAGAAPSRHGTYPGKADPVTGRPVLIRRYCIWVNDNEGRIGKSLEERVRLKGLDIDSSELPEDGFSERHRSTMI
jgi:hypothetical protein